MQEVKTLKLNTKNIKSTLIRGNKELKKLRANEKTFLFQQKQEQKKINRENFVESKKQQPSKIGGAIRGAAAPAMGFIDKLKEFFGTILLGIAINNLPTLIKKVQDWLEENKGLINVVKAVITGLGNALNFIVKLFIGGGPDLGKLKKQNKDLQEADKEFAEGGKFEKEVDGLQKDVDGLDTAFKKEFKEEYLERTPEQVREDVVEAIQTQEIGRTDFIQATKSYIQATKSEEPTPQRVVVPGIGSYQKVKDRGFLGLFPSIKEKATDTSGTEISVEEFSKRYSAVTGDNFTPIVEQLKDAGVEGFSQGGATSPARQGATGEEKIARRDINSFLDLKTSATKTSKILDSKDNIATEFKKTIEKLKSYLDLTKKESDDPIDPLQSPYTVPTPQHQGPTTQLPPPDPNAKGSVVTFSSEQGKDRSGEPGVDFSFADFYNNYSIFPGKVVEVGSLYGSGYGRHVTVRSVDQDGKEFDALYAHFGRFAVKEGDMVQSGDYLGTVGWDSSRGVAMSGAGNMTGPHTSVDFYEPNTRRGQVTPKYSGSNRLSNLIVNHANKDVKNIQLGSPAPAPPGGGRRIPSRQVIPTSGSGIQLEPLTPFQRKHLSGGKGGLRRSEQLTQTFDGEGMTEVIIIKSTQPIIVPGPTRYIRR